MSKRTLTRLFFSTLCFACIVAFDWRVSQVRAERLESDSYVIQFGNFNVTSGQKGSSSYNLTDTVGQTGAGAFGEYGTSGYFVGAGFQYIYQIKTFSFVISDVTMDLGELIDGAFGTDSHTMEITTRGAGGYTIYAYEEHPLRLIGSSNIINNTTCDAGTCTTSSASIWANPAVDGFGFNIQGDDIPSDFVNNTYFRPFANNEALEAMQPVMSSPNIAIQRTSTVTYQAAKAGDTAAGQFETAVVYVAVPGF